MAQEDQIIINNVLKHPAQIVARVLYRAHNQLCEL